MMKARRKGAKITTYLLIDIFQRKILKIRDYEYKRVNT